MNTMISDVGEIVLYQPDESVKLEVKLDNDTVWLNQQQMADLYGTKRQAITKHLANIYDCQELDKDSTSSILEQVRKEGNRSVTRKIEFYNLDVIISVGYRVNTKRGILFRQWANKILKDYLLRGYSVNQHLVALQQQMDSRFSALEQQVVEQQEKVDFLVNMHQQPTEELFATGCMWDAYSYMANLIRSAKVSVVLVDNYCNDKTLTLLDERASEVTATIHTTYNKGFETALAAHNCQKTPIEFIQLPHKIHDRFLIIDSHVYLLGNSLKDMGHTLSSAILTGFTPEDILSRLK